MTQRLATDRMNPRRAYLERLAQAVELTNAAHHGAKLDLQTAHDLLCAEGAESHHVRQTLKGVMARLKPKPKTTTPNGTKNNSRKVQ